MRIRSNHFEDVYLAGLLHDIGIILEDQYVHKPFEKMVEVLQQGRTLAEFERDYFVFDHMLLGEEIARTWTMPEGIVDTIRHHHGVPAYSGAHREIVHCVEAANFVCSLRQLTSVGIQLTTFPRDAILDLGLSKTDLLVIAEDLDREMNNNQTLFQL